VANIARQLWLKDRDQETMMDESDPMTMAN
jgi:hypothetical protein